MSWQRIGKTQIVFHCRKLIPKKACENDCDFICKLNKKGGTKDTYSLSVIAQQFHLTLNQLRCAVSDGILHTEIVRQKTKQIILLEKSEVTQQLARIMSYPKRSDAEKERGRKFYRRILNNVTIDSMYEDLCTMEEASKEFGIGLYKIQTAWSFGIIHNCEGLRDYRTKYLLSRAEIKEKLELIKKGNRMFYRILMKRQPPLEQHIKSEIPENNLDLQKIEMKL